MPTLETGSVGSGSMPTNMKLKRASAPLPPVSTGDKPQTAQAEAIILAYLDRLPNLLKKRPDSRIPKEVKDERQQRAIDAPNAGVPTSRRADSVSQRT